MPYKTIVLTLLQENPSRYQLLRTQRRLMPTLNRTTRTLKDRHAYWIEALSWEQPGSDPRQLSSAALEIVLQELQDALPLASPPNGSVPEPTSLDTAMAWLRRHTPPA